MPLRLRQLDRQFARFYRTRDAAALSFVFDRTAAELLHVAAWLVRNRADADDLLQRTFLTAIEQRAAFAQQRRVRPWLLAILANHARNLRRARARTAPELPPPAPAVDPVQAAADAEFASWLAAAQAAIGPPYQEVLELHLQQGLNAREIAERLGRPAGTVRTQLMRALQRLRRQLPSGFVAAAIGWRIEPAALAAARAEVLAAVPPAAAVVCSATVPTILLGLEGLLVGKKLIVLLPVLALAFLLFAPMPWSAPTALVHDGDPAAVVAAMPSPPPRGSASPSKNDRVALDGRHAEVAAGRWLGVRRCSDGTAVPGAEVWLAPSQPPIDYLAAVGADVVIPQDLVAWARAHGEHHTADAHGRVPLPPPARAPVLAVASCGDLLGTCEVRLAAEPPAAGDTLWLESDVGIAVRVVDEAGAPCAGVPVAFGWTLQRDGWRGDYQRAAARSDASGHARIEHAWLLPRPVPGSPLPDSRLAATWVALALPGFEGERVDVDLRAPAPVELMLPATGRIVVTTDAKFADGETQVALQGQGSTLLDHTAACRVGRDARVVFERVRLGRRFRLILGTGRVNSFRDVAGPTRPGETLELRIDLPPHFGLCGRACADGVPLRGQRLHYTLIAPDETFTDAEGRQHEVPPMNGFVRTDAEATFRIAANPDLAGSPRGLLSIQAVDDTGVETGAAAQLLLQPIPDGPEHDLGDVALRVPDVLCDGEVVFDDGSPCRTAELYVDRPGLRGLDYLARQQALGSFRVSWQEHRFTIRGDDRGEPLLLRLRAPMALAPTEPPLVTVPTRGLRLVLQRAGALVATLRADGFPPIYLDAELRDAQGRVFASDGHDEVGDGHIERSFGALPPGRYELIYGLRTQPEQRLRVPDLVVAAGATTRTAGAQALVVGARSCRVRLIDAATGEAIGPGRCLVLLHEPAGGRPIGFDGHRGTVTCIVQGQPEALCIAPEHESVRVQLTGETMDVRMRSATVAIDVRVAPPPLPLPPGCTLQLLLEPELAAADRVRPETPGGGGSMAEFAGRLPRAVDIQPGATLPLQLLRGSHRLRLRLQRAACTADVADAAPARLQLPGPAALDVSAPAAAWQRALTALLQ